MPPSFLLWTSSSCLLLFPFAVLLLLGITPPVAHAAIVLDFNGTQEIGEWDGNETIWVDDTNTTNETDSASQNNSTDDDTEYQEWLDHLNATTSSQNNQTDVDDTDDDLTDDYLPDEANNSTDINSNSTTPDDDEVEELLVVMYEYWSLVGDANSSDFMTQFQDVALALGSRADFTPHFAIYDGNAAGCHTADGQNQCTTLCTNHGRYCANDPDDDLYAGVSGANVVTESLRRICIWSHYGIEDGVGMNWWNYVNEFLKSCNEPDDFASPDCIKDAFSLAGINETTIETCMSDSGGLEEDTSNNKLDYELQMQKDLSVISIPTAFVNHEKMLDTTPASIFKAICSAYGEGLKPEICEQCDECPDVLGCVKGGGACGFTGDTNSTNTDVDIDTNTTTTPATSQQQPTTTVSCPTRPLADCSDLAYFVSPNPELCTCQSNNNADIDDPVSWPTTFECTAYDTGDVWCQGSFEYGSNNYTEPPLRTPGCPAAVQMESPDQRFEDDFDSAIDAFVQALGARECMIVEDALWSCEIGNVTCGGVLVYQETNSGNGSDDDDDDDDNAMNGTIINDDEIWKLFDEPTVSPVRDIDAPTAPSPTVGDSPFAPTAAATLPPTPRPTSWPTPSPTTHHTASNNKNKNNPGMVDDEYILFQDDDSIPTDDDDTSTGPWYEQLTQGGFTNNQLLIAAAVLLGALTACYCVCCRRSSRPKYARNRNNYDSYGDGDMDGGYSTGYRHNNNNTYQGISEDQFGDLELQPTSYGDMQSGRGLEFRNGQFM